MDYRPLIARFHRFHLLRRLQIVRSMADETAHFSQLPLLEHILAHPGCTQRQAADEMRVSPPAVATSVKRLQKAGLLQKEIDTQNLRCSHLFLTPEGEAVATRCRERFDALDEAAFAGFSEEELAALGGFLDRLLRNMALQTGESAEITPQSMHALMDRVRQATEEREERQPDD